MPEETDALLTRLSQKAGVQSTLVLSRSTGAIVRTSGLISSSTSPNPNSVLPASSPSPAPTSGNGISDGVSTGPNRSGNGGMHNAEQLAQMVHAFVSSAGGLVKGLDGEDEVKLLRLRTRRNELVIVPDSNFLLVVIHETPPA
ncbi:MAG: hypothetical protein M1817_003785 [Caeruleum heppii]|nr:MAG: hypothetical protein M1817_003785 [Caeruleum heppii]